jgi:hypothetical protein
MPAILSALPTSHRDTCLSGTQPLVVQAFETHNDCAFHGLALPDSWSSQNRYLTVS